MLIEGLNGFALTSPEFAAGGILPVEVGALEENRSPALQWTATPAEAAELALVVMDPTGASVYWLVTGIPAHDGSIPPGTVPAGAVVQPNSAGNPGYDGPIVVTGATATVVFRLFALGQPLTLDPDLQPDEAVHAIAAASFATATLSAVYTGEDDSPQVS